MNLSNKHILIVVENLPVPFDTRVWQEANALKKAGADVSIISPVMKEYIKRYECIDGINIYRHPLPFEANTALGYLLEYTSAFFWQFLYSWKIYVKKRFHVIHGCNPPDLIFLVAIFFKLFGVKYVFDHHDLAPELYLAKFKNRGVFYSLIKLFERLTFKTANFSIATNESYKEIAIKRGKMSSSKVHVIRSGPDLDRMSMKPVNKEYKKGRQYLVGYVGVIGEQEGLPLLLESARYVINKGYDVQFAIIGSGTELEAIKQLSGKMALQEHVDFYGRVPDHRMTEILSSADVCVNPDEPTVMNQLSTMNKIMEYMALKKPVVQYDLKEGRISAQEASLYARSYDIEDFAEKIILLLNDERERLKMGEYGYLRIVNHLSWDHQRHKLIKLYNQVFSNPVIEQYKDQTPDK